MDQNQTTQNPNPTPTPIPVVAPKTPWYEKSWIAAAGSAILSVGLLVGYDQLVRPRPAPYLSPVEQAAKTYYETLGSHYHLVATQIRSNQLVDQNSTIDALSKHAQPLSVALDSATRPDVDQTQPAGKFINAPAVADILDSVAKQMGAKF